MNLNIKLNREPKKMRQQPYEHLSSDNFQSQSAPMSQISSKTAPPAAPLTNIANLLNSPSSLPAIGNLLGNFLKPSGNSTAPPFNNRPNSPAPNSASTHTNNSPLNLGFNPTANPAANSTNNPAYNSTYNSAYSATNITNGSTNNLTYGRPNNSITKNPATYTNLPAPPPLSPTNFYSSATNNKNSSSTSQGYTQSGCQEKTEAESYKQNREQTQTLQNEEFYPSINPQFALETLLNPKKQPQQRASGLENNHAHVLKQMQLHNEYISRLKKS